MNDIIRVSAVSLNQTPLKWEDNIKNIQEGIDQSVAQGAQLIVTPELSVTGYGCEDDFFMQGMDDVALEMIHELEIPENVAVIVGLPVSINGRLYNGAALVVNDSGLGPKIKGIYLKQNLAKNGIHYEPRWFNAWTKGDRVLLNLNDNYKVPVGDVTFHVDGVRIGMEICEDAWVSSRPGRDLFERCVDVIINPSASHFSIGKYKTREQFVSEGSRAFGAAYIYANLNGCESGRSVFDGGNLIASGGKIIGRGERLFYKEVSVVVSDIDLWENRLTHKVNSQSLDRGLAHSHCDVDEVRWIQSDEVIIGDPLEVSRWEKSEHIDNEEAVRAIALGLYDWLKKTNTDGFTLSLSGGADSALVAAEVALMVRFALDEYNPELIQMIPKPLQRFFDNDGENTSVFKLDNESYAKEINKNILTTIYQGTINSGDVTLNAAKKLANGMGALFDNWIIDEGVNFYTTMVGSTIGRELNWEQDDIALQNIQARTRSPGIWMVANIKNQLLLTTGNLSESAVGYMTQDGDTSGVLAPIIGVRKTRVRSLLKWLSEDGVAIRENNLVLNYLDDVVKQQPTAELRPGEQTDEEDLMPFPILDGIIMESLILRRNPVGIFKALKRKFPHIDNKDLVGHIKRYYNLFNRNQWKRDRSAPGFHIETDSLDPKTFARFSLLHGGFKKELAELNTFL